MILLDGIADIHEIGGKAFHLFRLQIKNTPTLRVVPSSFFQRMQTDEKSCNTLCEELQKTLKEGS